MAASKYIAKGKIATHVCRNCGAEVIPYSESRGSGCLAIVLLCFFIIPGIIYIVWAETHRVAVCPKCKGHNTVIPIDSPQAKAIEASQRDEVACPYCAEPILRAASVCKHCGRDVQPPSPSV